MEGRLPHDAKRIAIWLPNRGRPWNVVSSPAIKSQENFFTPSGGLGGFKGNSFILQHSLFGSGKSRIGRTL
jgi:hypothetical protein